MNYGNILGWTVLILSAPFVAIGFIAQVIKDAVVFGWELSKELGEKHGIEPKQPIIRGKNSDISASPTGLLGEVPGTLGESLGYDWLNGPTLGDLAPGPHNSDEWRSSPMAAEIHNRMNGIHDDSDSEEIMLGPDDSGFEFNPAYKDDDAFEGRRYDPQKPGPEPE